MKILISLTYYRPHTSGLTIYAERLAKAFMQKGHKVTILTSQYDKKLQKEEEIDGVKIIRMPVLFRISKGVIMPTLIPTLIREIRQHDAVQIHLPQFDASMVAFLSRLFGKPTILTYHCDLLMPKGFLNWLANQAVHLMNHIAAKFANQIITYTQDYANHSPFLKHYLQKLVVIPPPVEIPLVTTSEIVDFREKNNPEKKSPVIGMAARFATEKGVEILIRALPSVLEKYPSTVVHFAGPYQNIIGEEKYASRLLPLIEEFESKRAWQFLGILNENAMACFYSNIDLLVIPSLNSTEAFGLVQIESMMMGKPVIVSDLPGVRQPVQWHHMGEIVKVGDSEKLANAILLMLKNIHRYSIGREELVNYYSPTAISLEYEKLFIQLLKNSRRNEI